MPGCTSTVETPAPTDRPEPTPSPLAEDVVITWFHHGTGKPLLGCWQGGGDGFSVAAGAPDAAVDLVKYIASVDVQIRMVKAEIGHPVRSGAQHLVDPLEQPLLDAQRAAGYVSRWLDQEFGPIIGTEMDTAIVDVFGGQGSAQGVVEAMTAAVETL